MSPELGCTNLISLAVWMSETEYIGWGRRRVNIVLVTLVRTRRDNFRVRRDHEVSPRYQIRWTLDSGMYHWRSA